MATLSDRDWQILELIFTGFALLIAVVYAYSTPFENFLSQYNYFKLFPWYPFWRIATVTFFMWLFSLPLVSHKTKRGVFFNVCTSIVFIVSHYATLLVIMKHGYQVVFSPLLYSINWKNVQLWHVDMGQIVLIILFIQLFLMVKARKNATSGTPPQTPSSTSPTP